MNKIALLMASLLSVSAFAEAKYVAVDWIQSSGTQYIDTSVKPTATLKTELAMTPEANGLSCHALFGCAWTDTGYFAVFYQNMLQFNTSGTSSNFTDFNSSGRNQFVFETTGVTVNGARHPIVPAKADTSANIHLFDSANDRFRGIFKLHRLTMTDGETVVRDFVPVVRLPDGQPGLLDYAHLDDLDEAFYVNAASGADFTASAPTFRLEGVPTGVAFTGVGLEPPVTVCCEVNGVQVALDPETDYEVAYLQNVGIGTAKIVVTGKGLYAGFSATASFEILPPEDGRIRMEGDFGRRIVPAGGSAKLTSVSVLDQAGKPLSPDAYVVGYVNNDQSGRATVFARVTGGPLAGALAATTFPVVVLPEGYRRIEYLKSSGTQYIDTGVKPTATLTTDLELTPDPAHLDLGAILGCAWTATGYFAVFYQNALQFSSGGATVYVYDFKLREPNRVVCTPTSITVNGAETSVPGSGANDNKNIRLFDGNKSTGRGVFELHWLMMSDGKTVLRDFIPVVCVADGKPGLFDLAHLADGAAAFYGNADGGVDFIPGPLFADFVIDPIPPQAFDGTRPCRPAPTIRMREGGAVLDSNDFVIEYANDDAVGEATVTVTGRTGTRFEQQTTRAGYVIFTCYRVTGWSLPAEGTGGSWASPVSLTNALSLAACGGGEIWVKGGTFDVTADLAAFQSDAEVVIRGGFAGNESAPSERDDKDMSWMDGGDRYDSMVVCNGKKLTFERIGFRRGKNHGFVKSGGDGILVMDGCRFCSNGTNTTASLVFGRGASFSGEHAVVTLTNCVIEGNIDRRLGGGSGHGLFFKQLGRAVLLDCLIRGNGYESTCQTFSGEFDASGVGIYSVDVPIEAVRCRFSANVCQASDFGSVVFLKGSQCVGSVFRNCQWTGNRDTKRPFKTDSGGRGALLLGLGSRTLEVTVENCTFAYNLCGTTVGAAGVNVFSGTARIRNSIFFGNVVSSGGTNDNDIQVLTDDGQVIASYTLIDHEPPSATCDHRVVGDPSLVTTLAKFLACIDAPSPAYPKTDAEPGQLFFKTDAGTLAGISSINVHLRGGSGYLNEETGRHERFPGRSPAIDAGDPDSDFSKEPMPNGKRINLGAYGNTPYATARGRGMMLILK